MSASTATAKTWYGHLESIDPALAVRLEKAGFHSVSDLHGGLGVRLIMTVGDLHAMRIAEEIQSVD